MPPDSAFPLQSRAWQEAAVEFLAEPVDAGRQRLAAYRELLLEAGKRVNLTAIRDPDGIDFRLILDALRLAPVIREYLREDPSASSLIDIGSGAGIPGIPLAIALPELRVTMIEATGKKSWFIEQAISQLGIENATVIHGRAEDLGRDARWRESRDLAVARAVGSLPTLLELAMPLVRVGGRAWFPKGTLGPAELEAGRRAAAMLGAAIIDVVMLEQIEGCPLTNVVRASKMGPMTDHYPRRPGVPAREPLGGYRHEVTHLLP
jgi:16S rRNA (guanine527-N7)-methyltransferase